MAAFAYIAQDSLGQSQKGLLEADSERHARQLLRERQLLPVSVSPINRKQSSRYPKQTLQGEQMALITRQLATLIGAGLPIEESLLAVSEQQDSSKVKELLLGVRAKVLEGYSLAQAFEQFPAVFPPLFCATVHAGEQTGRLDLILNRLALHSEEQQKIRQKIQQALIYPAVMTAVSIAIVSFLLTFVVPKIIQVFDNTGQTLPPLTKALIAISYFLRHYGLTIVIIVSLILFGLTRALKKPALQYQYHTFLLKLPLIGYLISNLNTARYSHTFGLLSSAGVPVLRAMAVASQLVSNLPIQKQLVAASQAVKEGTSISNALKKSGYFRPMSLHLIASGESSGQLDDMLTRAASNQDAEVERLIDTGLTLFEPLIILLMGAVVLFIVLATLLPIFSMDQLVT